MKKNKSKIAKRKKPRRPKSIRQNREMPTRKELEAWAQDNNKVHFINFRGHKLVLFNPDRFVWNAFGKDSIDRDNRLSDEQWYEMKCDEDYLCFNLEDIDEACQEAIENYLKNNEEDDGYDLDSEGWSPCDWREFARVNIKGKSYNHEKVDEVKT